MTDVPPDAVSDQTDQSKSFKPAERNKPISASSDRLVPRPSSKPVIPDTGIEKLLDPNAPSECRYTIGTLLGTGSSSHVYAGHDNTFDREVAIKFLESGLAEDARRLSRFVREAQMTARLDHPNIVPVYDLDATPTGDLYLTMRRVNGVSLGDALRRAAGGELRPELGDLNRRVNILNKVSDALACAHDRGIAHLDVKPDNIMLGAFGEVVLVDWGLARRFDEAPRARQHISGTPAYMSPEQSLGHPGDALADVYCLGATMFHALTLRYPTWSSDEQEFWIKKRAGLIDPPTDEERARIPKQLLAIALKAMAVDRDQRYPSVKALGEDLLHFQAGLTVSAYRESRLERGRRWYRSHARSLWVSTAAVVAVIASTLSVYGEHMKEVAVWGTPVYQQTFSDDSWRADFVDIDSAEPSQWERQDGRLVDLGPTSNFTFLHRRFYGSLAVEFDGEIKTGSTPGDLSLVWSSTDPLVKNPDDRYLWRNDSYFLQTGANDNTQTTISSGQVVTRQVIVRNTVSLIPGRLYHLRFEIDGERLSIDLDGKRICEYQTSFPCTSGFIGLYSYFPGKAFDNLTVYTKDVPQRVRPTTIGDAFYRRDLPLKAAEQYSLVAESFAGTTLGDEARYKQGLCLAKLDKEEEALAVWGKITGREFTDLAECSRIEWLNVAGNTAEAVKRFTTLYRNSPAMRPRLHLVFADCLVSAERIGLVNADLWMGLTQDVLPSEPTVDWAAARMLINQGRFEMVVKRYPHIEQLAGWALCALGRPDEMLRRYPNSRPGIRRKALIALGRLDQAIHDYPKSDIREILHLQGRHEEALALAVTLDEKLEDLLRLGRAEEVLAKAQFDTLPWAAAMIHLGRIDRAMAMLQNGRDNTLPTLQSHARKYEVIQARFGKVGYMGDQQVNYGVWLSALERHDSAAAAAALALAHPAEVSMMSDIPWFMRYIVVDFVHANGNRAAFMTAMRALISRSSEWLAQRPWYAARYLTGDIDEAGYLAQPARDHASAALLVLRGMLSELSGDSNAAHADYRTYLALPVHLRAWDQPDGDPIIDHFVAWRLAVTGG